MKVVSLSKAGIETASPVLVETPRGNYWCLVAGESGRGRWEYRIPLAAREFPATDRNTPPVLNAVRLIDLRKQDKRGNPLYLVVKGEEDGQFLVIWNLSMGFRGGADYRIEGQAKLLGEGVVAQGAAGRMGSPPAPVVLVDGPCRLTWHRYGRLYGQPADWVADFDGQTWSVRPDDQCEIDDAALAY